MARRGGRKGGGGIKRNKYTGEAYSGGEQEDPDKFLEAIAGAAEGLTGFTKNLVEGSAEFKRAEAAISNLSSSLALPGIQDLAGAISPGLGSAVGSLRRGLGNVAAAGASAQDLEDLSVQSAAAGVPLSKDELEEFKPLFKARRQAMESARQLAADVNRDDLQKEVKASAESLGVPTSAEGFKELFRELAREIVEEIRSKLPIFGGGGGR